MSHMPALRVTLKAAFSVAECRAKAAEIKKISDVFNVRALDGRDLHILLVSYNQGGAKLIKRIKALDGVENVKYAF